MIEAHMNYPVWSSHQHANKRKHLPISHNITLCIWLLSVGLISACLHHVNLSTPMSLAQTMLSHFVTIYHIHMAYMTYITHIYSTADFNDMICIFWQALYVCKWIHGVWLVFEKAHPPETVLQCLQVCCE